MGWLSKAVLPHLQGKSKRSAVVAPAPEYDSLADSALAEKATGLSLAWQASTGPLAQFHGASDALAGNCSPELPDAGGKPPAVSEALTLKKSQKPMPSPAALSESLRLTEALSSSTGENSEARCHTIPIMDARSYDGNAAFPIELIDGSIVPDMGGLDIESILPPLPKVDAHKLNADGSIPGCAAEILDLPAAIADSLRSPTDADCKDSILLSKARPRPTSFRGLSRRCDSKASVTNDPVILRNGHASSQTAVRGGSDEVSSVPRKPTSTGDEATANFQISHQSARSVAWMEQWTPGGETPLEAVGQQPLPPPLPGPGAATCNKHAASTSSTLTAQSAEELATSPASHDPSELALKQASQKASLQWATAPINRRRWSKLIEKGAEESIDLNLAEVAESPSKSRPVSRELHQRAVQRADFSELALSFASLDEGT